jgi:hypothetical protein
MALTEARRLARRAWAALSTDRWLVAIDLLLLVGIVWGARFWYSSGFGLYEDDYTKVAWAMRMSWAEVWHQIAEYFRTLGDNAKPLHAALIFLLSFVSTRIGGLDAAYVLGFSIVAANCLLFYLLLRRIAGRTLAWLGGIAFALFPADTSQALLTHAFGLQWSLLFLLLAFHAYLSERWMLAYALSFLILITYETPFPVFVVAPFLGVKWSPSVGRQAARHVLVLLAILVAVVVGRAAAGEARVQSLRLLDAVRISLMHMALGPVAVLGLAAYRPYQVLASLDLRTALAWAACFAVLFLWAGTLGQAAGGNEALSGFDFRVFARSLRDRESRVTAIGSMPAWLRLLLVGGAMLVLAYPLTFTLSAFESTGRATRVHMAAGLGASLVFAVLAASAIHRWKGTAREGWLRGGLAAVLAFYFAFGLLVQRDYLEAWDLQRSFWSQLVHAVPDAGENTVILIDPAGLEDTGQIGANTWNLPRVFEYLYDFPSAWETPPRVYRLQEGWQEEIVTEKGLFRLDAATVSAPPSYYEDVSAQDVVLVESETGSLIRAADQVVLDGRAFQLHPVGTPLLATMPTGPLYAEMLEG